MIKYIIIVTARNKYKQNHMFCKTKSLSETDKANGSGRVGGGGGPLTSQMWNWSYGRTNKGVIILKTFKHNIDMTAM